MASLWTGNPMSRVLDWGMADLRVGAGVDLMRRWLQASSPAVEPEVRLPIGSHYV
jgi:hypothetical protein